VWNNEQRGVMKGVFVQLAECKKTWGHVLHLENGRRANKDMRSTCMGNGTQANQQRSCGGNTCEEILGEAYMHEVRRNEDPGHETGVQALTRVDKEGTEPIGFVEGNKMKSIG
jgi:hypothetical protein